MAGTKIDAAETVSLFCRLNLNGKKELPVRSSEMGLLILLGDKQREDYTESGSRFFWSQQTDGCFYGKIPDAWWIYPQRGNRTGQKEIYIDPGSKGGVTL